ncbi:MAG: hypothetical protein IKQ17_05175, partial [Kiritimatiellae bacterium]|nr:hypothetical protein [Kiritimatiellia bacterium]
AGASATASAMNAAITATARRLTGMIITLLLLMCRRCFLVKVIGKETDDPLRRKDGESKERHQ